MNNTLLASSRVLAGLLVVSCLGCQKDEPEGADGGSAGRGLVRIATSAQTIVGRQVFQTQAGAIFSGASSAACVVQEAGACSAYVCQGGAGRQPDAGAITLGSGAAALTLAVGQEGGYAGFLNTTAALWAGGQKVAVLARGGVVPAFVGEVEMPADGFDLSQPVISPMLTLEVTQGADLPIAWTGGGAQVRLEIGQDMDTTAGRLILCTFAGAGGKGVVPASLLSLLLPTVGVEHGGLFLVGPARTAAQAAGSWAVEIVAIGGGRSALMQVNAAR